MFLRSCFATLVFISMLGVGGSPQTTSGPPTGTMPPADWHLSPSSPYKNKGTNGKDPGADIDAVQKATCGVIEGRPCSGLRPPGFPHIK